MEMDKILQYKVAMVQMDTGKDLEKNLKFAENAASEAAREGARLVCYPERMNVQAGGEAEQPEAETVEGITIQTLKKVAQEERIYIHCGSILEKIDGEERSYNTSFFISPKGEILGQYRKMHTFDVTLPDGISCAESDYVKPGEDIVVIDTELGKIGFAICYDIRFPELFRKMTLLGAQIIVVAASFTETTGRDHWEPILRARAIENEVYILAIDQTGQKPSFMAHGNSMLIDPWGRVLANAGQEEIILYGTVDLEYEQKIREQIPCLKNRRSECYGVNP